MARWDNCLYIYRTFGPKESEFLTRSDKSDTALTLDKYLAKHTSEDNASFDEIMATSAEKHRQKHAWLYEAEKVHGQEQKDMLALEGPKAGKPTEGSSVTTWGYKAKNAVMYPPEGKHNSTVLSWTSRDMTGPFAV